MKIVLPSFALSEIDSNFSHDNCWAVSACKYNEKYIFYVIVVIIIDNYLIF